MRWDCSWAGVKSRSSDLVISARIRAHKTICDGLHGGRPHFRKRSVTYLPGGKNVFCRVAKILLSRPAEYCPVARPLRSGAECCDARNHTTEHTRDTKNAQTSRILHAS